MWSATAYKNALLLVAGNNPLDVPSVEFGCLINLALRMLVKPSFLITKGD